MKFFWISFLLILSIVLQSFVAVANTNETHQLDAQHIQSEHSHDVDHIALSTDSADDDHYIKDCHHCGHCQGSHSPWFTAKKSYQVTTNLLVLNQYYYLQGKEKSVIEALMRPPIS